MSAVDDLKPGNSVKAFEPKLPCKPFAWPKRPTHYPAKRPVKAYRIEVGENGDMPFIAHPTPFKNTLN